ncbi:MAG TPA: glycoside hydrolase family 38 C-terminal domain-containing protein [Chloroflexota bacterium]|nr:glycoside hydrolase family 38 C-terminal domain-containing protein [Chloroflexota bacterium]
MSRQLHIVAHSHWDREWHQTFQQFRLRLIQLIDQVLVMLAADPALPYFMLDGQTIMLDDYIEIRPERRDELRARIGEGRLLIGPWYVQPDEFLASGEALVRNLLQGLRDCQAWGDRMLVGYVPDQFGHIAQLPRIWRDFGIASSVLWRGIDRQAARLACTWQGHDGATVLLVPLPDGYNQAEHLPTGGQALAERLRSLAASLEPLAGPRQPLLIMNGGDHTLLNQALPGALPAAQAALGERYALVQSTLPAYIAALQEADPTDQLLTGELRSSRSVFLLAGVTSSRMWIKQRNAALQTLLERQTEPLTAVAAALGAPHPGAVLRQSWRYLLQNQPHDSICGCSIDQVHREMITRYDWSEQIATALRTQALATLAAHVGSVVAGAEDPHTLAVTIFNGADVAQRGRIDLGVRLAGEAATYELVDTEGLPVPHAWSGEQGEPPSTFEMPLADAPDQATILAQLEGNRMMGLGLQEISMRTVGSVLKVEITVGDQALLAREDIEHAMSDAFTLIQEAGCERVAATIYRSAELRLAALVPPVPAFGYRTLLLRPRARPPAVDAPESCLQPALPAIENERYRVEANVTTGALTLTERTSGLRIGPANVFQDDGEAGDLYTHAAPSLDTVVAMAAPPHIAREIGPFGQTLHIDQELQVPVALAESRFERATETVALGIRTSVTLQPDDALVRFHVTVVNQARDHRLRVHTTVPFVADHAHVTQAFAVIRRAAQPDRAGSWAEEPTGTAPHQGVVAVHGDGGCCLLAARGLPEYEVLPQADGSTQLALTLLRCSGWLSRSDLAVRPADAGPSLPTPEGQCPGTHQFDYALAFGAEPWHALLPAARAFAVDLCALLAPCAEGWLPPAASLVQIDPPAVVISALKGAEDGRGAILRIYNHEPCPHAASVRLLFPATRATIVDLAEQDRTALDMSAPFSDFTVTIPAHGIVSVRLEWQAAISSAPAT